MITHYIQCLFLLHTNHGAKREHLHFYSLVKGQIILYGVIQMSLKGKFEATF